jgi:hypothetical protein
MSGSAWPRVMPRVRTIKLSQEAEEKMRTLLQVRMQRKPSQHFRQGQAGTSLASRGSNSTSKEAGGSAVPLSAKMQKWQAVSAGCQCRLSGCSRALGMQGRVG